jgi:2-haloacid dehalogenase
MKCNGCSGKLTADGLRLTGLRERREIEQRDRIEVDDFLSFISIRILLPHKHHTKPFTSIKPSTVGRQPSTVNRQPSAVNRKTMKQLTTIIFDLGGVLIDWNPEYVFQELIPDAERRAYFFQNICTHEWNIEQDAGRPLAVGTDMLVEQFPEWEPEIRAFYGRWEEMLGGPIDETVELLRILRDQGSHRLLALTNWSGETFPVALERYDFLQWFEGIVVSGDEGTRKPFADIYQILLDRYEVNPAEAVFIDDSAKNIEGAEALSIKGIHFQNAAQLREVFENWKVLP